MPKLDISTATNSNSDTIIEDATIDAKNTDGVGNQDETEWQNSNFSKYWGYFNEYPDLKNAILMKAIWNVGKGWTADPETQVTLENIRGWGKDTFDDIIFNMDVISMVNGDAYAEIIKDPDTNIVLNLKPLDPASMKIIVDRKGIIKRYEQVMKLPNKTNIIKFKPEEILHISYNRLADQIHGISVIESLDSTILADKESFNDVRGIMHRQAKPFIIFKLKTDNQTKIDELASKIDNIRNKGQDLYIPDDENILSYEVVQVNIGEIILAWRNDIRKRFYRTIGLPELIPSGGGDATESGGKIGYLAFEQIIEQRQRFWERQLLTQLNIKFNLIPPASLSSELQADNAKDGAANMLNFQPSDMIAGRGK